MIDVIIMAIDYQAYPELFQEALHAAQYGILVVPVTTMYEKTSGKIPVEYIVDQWYTVMPSDYASSPLYACWNKLLDLAFGLCGLIILALAFPFLALLIYLDSPGPIFYTQERTGYHGRTFSIYKFRSMHTETEQAKRPAWVTKGDSRITRVGRFLRATHLDEVPQVLNILRGEMSLIGPRPERPAYVAELEKSNLFYRYRLSIKPGLTGWAQVKYGYGITDQDELVKLQYDLYYIKHRSLLVDLLIILKTFVEVGFGHGS
jgi:lipopolysaccharide/colanic/teichoic acid biosynthesis glycosyltransferase